jgi:hypothetical protein
VSASSIHGTWSLTSIYAKTKSGKKIYHFGKDAVGRLTYTPDGYMHVFIMQSDRKDPSTSSGSDDVKAEEWKNTYDSFDAYSGKYTIDFENKIVTHHVDLARSPSWSGINLIRYFELHQDRFSLYTEEFDSDLQEENIVVYVEWQRSA